MKKAFALWITVLLAGCLGGGTGDFGSGDGDADADSDGDGDGDPDPRCAGDVPLCPYPEAVGVGGSVNDIVGNREWPGSGENDLIALQDFWARYMDGARVMYAHRYCQT